jgi:hypothetical protein
MPGARVAASEPVSLPPVAGVVVTDSVSDVDSEEPSLKMILLP